MLVERFRTRRWRRRAFIPYWLIPGAQLLPSQQEFNNDLDLLNTKLEELVTKAFDDIANMGVEVYREAGRRSDDDDEVKHTSLLRFLVTVRGEEASATQLRDDLMTMLVAGHETTAALLTWTFIRVVPSLLVALVITCNERVKKRMPCLRNARQRIALEACTKMYWTCPSSGYASRKG